jgi:alpha-N-arabinofuranosidase
LYAPCSGKALFLAAALLITSAALAQEGATLTIDLAQVKAKVSPQLYGLMTEEINYSYDGGVYAELARNRIQLDGAKAVGDGKLISMSAKTTAATNSIIQPAAIVPVESGLREAAANFTHTVPGYAIQLLELKTQ